MFDTDTAGDELLLDLRAAGLNNQEIAAQLRLHPVTVGRLLRALDGDIGEDPRETGTAHYWRPVIR